MIINEDFFIVGLYLPSSESKKCIQSLIKRNLQNKTRIFDKIIFSVYQRAILNFDILLEPFCENLAEILKFEQERLLKKCRKMAINAVSIFF